MPYNRYSSLSDKARRLYHKAFPDDERGNVRKTRIRLYLPAIMIGAGCAALLFIFASLLQAFSPGISGGTRPAPGSIQIFTPIASSDRTMESGQVFQRFSKSVVEVEPVHSATSPLAGISGLGIIVSTDGFIVTNYHVVVDANGVRELPAMELNVSFQNEDKAPASIVAYDRANDLALIKVEPKNLDLIPAVMGDSESVAPGEPIISIGNPLAGSAALTMTTIKSIDQTVEYGGTSIRNGIQTDAPLGPVESGGPLFNLRGEVIGVYTSALSERAASHITGIKYAVPINTAKVQFEKYIPKSRYR